MIILQMSLGFCFRSVGNHGATTFSNFLQHPSQHTVAAIGVRSHRTMQSPTLVESHWTATSAKTATHPVADETLWPSKFPYGIGPSHVPVLKFISRTIHFPFFNPFPQSPQVSSFKSLSDTYAIAQGPRVWGRERERERESGERREKRWGREDPLDLDLAN